MYSLLNTTGQSTIPEMQFQKKVVQSGDTGLEFVAYPLNLRLWETNQEKTQQIATIALVPLVLYLSALFPEEFNLGWSDRSQVDGGL